MVGKERQRTVEASVIKLRKPIPCLMPSQDYKLLLSEVDEIGDRVGLKDYHAFAYWFIETAFGYEKEKILNSMCDGTHDKGIDAVLVNPPEHQVTIIQSKFEHEGSETQIEEAEIERFAAVRNYFKGKKALSAVTPKANPSARRLLNEAFEAIYGHNFSLELVFITTHKSAPQIEPLVRDALGFKTGEFQIYHYSRIMQLIADRKRDFTPPLPAYSLPYQYEDAVMLRMQPYRSWVLSVSGEHLREFVKKYEYRLFRKNVRNFLGKNRCNKQIVETLEDDAGNFWYYNNGISILCDQGNVVPEHKYIRMENPQIVNGCQTARSIERYDGELKSDILVRVIESKSHDFVAKLTLYQNSSNPVKKRDLKSNDPVQVRLKRDFARRGYYFEIKRGEEFDRLSKKYRAMKQTYSRGPINNADVAKLELAPSAYLVAISYRVQKQHESRMKPLLLNALRLALTNIGEHKAKSRHNGS